MYPMPQPPKEEPLNSLTPDQRKQVEAELERQGLTPDSITSVHVEQPSPLAHAESLVRSGKHIEAIKEIRAQTGLGLAEAKKLADEMRAKFGMQPKSGCATMIVLCVIAGVLLAML